MRTIVLSSSLIAFSIACGYAKLLLFPYLFFVELFTVAVFLSGMLAGPAWGLWIGGVARLVFSVANPYGPPHPWILVAQVVGAALAGALGGLARPWLFRPPAANGRSRSRVAILLLCGFVATALYDTLTNVAQALAFRSLSLSIALGVIPALQHLASNLVIFAVAGNLAIPWLRLHPMAVRPGRTVVLVGAVMAAALAGPRLASAEAPPDTVFVAPPDTTLMSPADTTSTRVIPTGRGRVILTAPAAVDTAGLRERSIDVAAARKSGAASLEDLLPLRRAVIVEPLPLHGPTQGALELPDGGGPVRADGWIHAGETTTDEPLVGSVPLGWGAPWIAFALDDPRADAEETLDLDSIEFPVEAGDFRVPGEALTRPTLRGPAAPPAPGDTTRPGISKTTLVYRRGSGDAQLTGARFQTGVFHRGIHASYSRNEANGSAPLRESLSSRYAVRAELGRWASHRFDVDGLLAKRSIQDSSGGSNEWSRRHLALEASRQGARSSDAWRVRIGTGKETWVVSEDPNLSGEPGGRERWEFPTVSAEGAVSYRSGPALTWIVSGQAASRHVIYRADTLPAFDPRREEARARLGSRIALGASAGIGFDAAYDMRETESGFLDGRASLWGATERARGRIDVESAHQRPSWMDLLTPATLHSFFSPVNFTFEELSRSGDPSLEPRRLTGPLGFLAVTVLPGLDLELSGSYRRVTDDFGWEVSADSVAGVNRVTSVARERGSGWLSHGALGWEFRKGFLRSRGVGWIRGGPDSLSPQGGSPPRRALDAALEARVVLFQGDLPLRFGVESHARGPRRGLIREAAQVTWDGTLSADFGSAGAFVRVQDAFDRRPASAIWDPTLPTGALMPGRTFQFGVVWNLLD